MLETGLYHLIPPEVTDGPAEAAYNLGVHAYECSDIETAIQEFTRAVSLEPDVWPMRNNLGIALIQSGHPEEGLEQLRVAVRQSGDDPHALRNLGAALWVMDRNTQACEVLERAAEGSDEPGVCWFLISRARADAGDGEGAVEAVRKAVECDPDHPAAHANLGIALHQFGRLEEALEAYRRSAELDPEHALPPYNIATVLYDLERFEEAVEALRRHMRLDQEHSCPHWEIGRALSCLGRNEEALAEFRIYAELEPEDVRGACSVGIEMYYLDRFDEAERWLDVAEGIDAEYAAVWHTRCRIAQKRGQFDRALGAVERALTILPDDSVLRTLRMDVLVEARGLDEAVAEALKEREDSRLESIYAIVESLRDRERFDETVRVARMLTQQAPEQAWVWGVYGLALSTAGDPSAGLSAFRRLAALDPQDADAHAFIAMCHADLDQPRRAIAAADKALAINPADIRALEVRLWSLLRLKRLEDAELAVERLLEVDPENEFVKNLPCDGTGDD